jgi:hypothetical protein
VFEVPTATQIVERKVMENMCASFELLSLAFQRYIRRCEENQITKGEREKKQIERSREENSNAPYRV